MIYPSSISLSSYYGHEHRYEELKKRYGELKELSTFLNSRKKLTYQQNKILQFVATHCSISASDLSKQFPFSKKPIEYGNAKKDMRRLRDLNLLESNNTRIDDDNKHTNKKEMKNYYKMSKYGVYNLITNNKNLPFEIAKNLLLNYRDHLLFGFFLFPYIELDTLSKLSDSDIFSIIFSYLHRCCKQLEEMISDIDHTYNQNDGYLIDPLFTWENIPRIDYDRERLRDFLKQKFGWKWLEDATIRKTENENGIIISYELKSALISINKQREEAILSFRGKTEYEFIVRGDADFDQYTIYVPTVPIEEPNFVFFVVSNQKRISEVIFSLISNYSSNYLMPATEILGKDKRFIQALKKTKDQFDRSYDLVVRKIRIKKKASLQ